MKKRLLALVLCLALLLGTVSVTGVLGALAAEKTSVLCIGDSITFGYASRVDGSGYQLAKTWPKVLGNLLGSGYDVTNLGISGTTVVDGNGRESWLAFSQAHEEYAIPAADIALVMLGTNDSISDWSTSRKDAFKTEYKALIDAIKTKNSDVDIWVMTAPYTDLTDSADALAEVVALTKEFAQENGLHLIDVNASTKAYYDANGAEGYFGGYDIQLNVRLHPGEPALADIAKTVYEAMSLPAVTGSVAPTYLTGTGDAALLAGDNLAKPLLEEKIYENNHPVFKNVYSWYDIEFNGYNARKTPRYIRTTYDAQYNYLLTDGLLGGVTTDVNWSNSYISIGDSNHDRNGSHKPYEYATGRIVFDLGAETTLDRVVLGDCVPNTIKRQLWKGTLSVANSLDALFSDSTIVGTWSYLDSPYSFPASTDKLGVAFKLNGQISGRYVAVEVPADATAGYKAYFGELGIYAVGKAPVSTPSATVDYLCDESDAGYLTSAGTNLMADRLTVNGNMMNNVYTWFTFNHNNEPKDTWHHAQVNGENMYNGAMTDGSIYGVTDTNAEKAGNITVTVDNSSVNGGTAISSYGFVKIVFDLGKKSNVDRVLFGDQMFSAYGTTDLKGRLWQGSLYVGNAMGDTLFSDDAKCGEWSYLSEQDKKNGYLSGNSNVPAAKGVVLNFDTAATGRYVGIYVPATAAGGWQVRFSEIGIYGSACVEEEEDKPDDSGYQAAPQATVETLTSANLPADNRLAKATVVSGTGSNFELAVDGVVNGVNSNTDNKALIKTTTAGTVINPITGATITNASGWTQVGYQLASPTAIKQLVIAGSNSDATNVTGYTNKYVLYYEIYISNDAGSLFNTANRVLCYDNSSASPASASLAQLITLPEAVSGMYVGFKMTSGEYGQSYIGELGVYGDAGIAHVAINSQAGYDAIITDDMVNLLKGEAVPGKAVPYLEPQGVSLDDSEKPYLTDGYINWTADQELKQATYTVGDTKGLWYDLRGKADLKGILVANNRNDATRHRITSLTVYATNSYEALFTEASKVVAITLPASNIASYISLDGLGVNARYIGLAIAGDAEYGVVRLTELGVYGTYTETPKAAAQSLLTGALASRTDAYTISAHGIDNSTAGPGNKNTGALSGIRNFSQMENLNGLHDGNTEEHVYAHILQEGKAIHVYELEADSPWVVFAYYLGGSANLESINLISANELTKYYTTGVQYYASNTYADLFKDESLLYTTGGEKCITDPVTGKPALDPSTEVWRQRNISYTLTPEQQAKTYKFVACVVTRPYSLYEADLDGDGDFSDLRLNAYGVARLSEFDVRGSLTGGDKPLITTYTAQSQTLGIVTATIQPSKFDYDSPDFFYAIDRMEVTEETLPAGVSKNVDNNWMSVDGDTVFRIRFYGADGKQLTDTGNHDIQFTFTTGADYAQFVGQLEGGAIRRIVNASTQADGAVHVGMNNYPVYGSEQPNSRDLATLQGLEHRLVLLKYNDLDTIHQLSGTMKRPSISEFEAQLVAGATEESGRPVLPAVCVTVATVLAGILLVWLWWRKRRAVTEKGGEQA